MTRTITLIIGIAVALVFVPTALRRRLADSQDQAASRTSTRTSERRSSAGRRCRQPPRLARDSDASTYQDAGGARAASRPPDSRRRAPLGRGPHDFQPVRASLRSRAPARGATSRGRSSGSVWASASSGRADAGARGDAPAAARPLIRAPRSPVTNAGRQSRHGGFTSPRGNEPEAVPEEPLAARAERLVRRSRASASRGRAPILTVPGRRSGKLWSTPVSLVRRGGERWLVAPYGDRNWVLNARAAGWVELRRGRRRERLGVRELDPRAAVPVLREYYRLERVTRPFFDVTLDSSDEDWLREAPRHPVFGLERAES